MSAVKRFSIAQLRFAGGKEHDVNYVSEVHYDAALAREPVACNHEWTDDGQFLLVCTTCGAQEDYTQALQLAFELGGTDDGSYDLEADELCEVIRRHAEQPAPAALYLPDQMHADQNRLVRELDVLLNGEAGAAEQASLCDIVAQVRRERAIQSKPILLWKAPREPKPEPVALLSYCGKTFAINYTLMSWIEGWVTMGQVGTAVAALDAIDNTRAALAGVVAMMGRDASSMTPEQVAFYQEQGLYRETEWPYIKDYSEAMPEGAVDEQ